ncbi:hypothetical protein PMAYCL1PPCAC_21996, partial [Pristionchus mayeri]
IKQACICTMRFGPADFLLCSQMLCKSTFGVLEIYITKLYDTTAPHIISLASRAKEMVIQCEETQLSDSTAFITRLASDASFPILYHRSSSTSSFFGLPHSF